MRCFSACCICSSFMRRPHDEITGGAGRDVVHGLDVLDARAGRAATQPALEAVDSLAVAIRLHFHASVREIAHPADQVLDLRGFAGKEPEADTLHAAADQETP